MLQIESPGVTRAAEQLEALRAAIGRAVVGQSAVIEQVLHRGTRAVGVVDLRDSDELQIKIGDFAGPLDLLLFVIRQEQANIFDIPIARISRIISRGLRTISCRSPAIVPSLTTRPSSGDLPASMGGA